MPPTRGAADGGAANGAPPGADEPAGDASFESYAGPLRPRAGGDPSGAVAADRPEPVVPDLIVPPPAGPRPAGVGSAAAAVGAGPSPGCPARVAPGGKVPPRPRGAPPRARKKAPRRR